MSTLDPGTNSSLAGSKQDSSSTLASEQTRQDHVVDHQILQEKRRASSNPDTEQQRPPPLNDDPPNSGIKAWLQVLAAFIFFMNSLGLINTFGVFQTFYKSTFFPSESNSNIAWIGSIRAFVLLGSPILYGPIFDLGHPRLLAAYGTITIAFGIMMTSLCSELWQFILAQGVVVGAGSGALFLTSVAVIPTWFTTKKSLAMGIAASGSSIGGVIYPIIFRYIEPHFSFPWTVRTIGFITLATNSVACTFVTTSHKSEQRRSIFDIHLFKDRLFDLWSLAWFFGTMGLYIPYFFIQDYASNVLGQPMNTAFWTLTTINAASVFGRIIPGLIADKINDPILVITISTVATTLLAFSWISIRSSIGSLFVFCAFYGFFSGAFVSLSAPATVHLAPSMKGIGTRLGIFNGIGSLGLLIGNPVAGAIVEKSYTGMQLFCAVACLMSLVFLVCVLLYVRGGKRRSRK